MNNLLLESWAIAKRELKKRYSLWKDLLSIFVLFIVFISVGYGIGDLVKDSYFGQSYSLFFSSGMIGLFLVVIVMAVGMDFIIDKKGFNKLLLIAPISRISIIFGKMLYLIISTLKTLFITALIMMLYFSTLSLGNVAVLVFMIIFGTILFLGLLLVISSFIKKSKNADIIFQILLFYFMFCSGAMFKIDNIYGITAYLFYLNPATYIVELSRYAISGYSTIPLYISLIIIFVLGVLFLFLGTYLYDKHLREG
jgi:ABC-2 type transport system permease protein